MIIVPIVSRIPSCTLKLDHTHTLRLLHRLQRGSHSAPITDVVKVRHSVRSRPSYNTHSEVLLTPLYL